MDYFVHSSSIVEKDVIIGQGTKIWHFSHVDVGASIGIECSFGQNSIIGAGIVISKSILPRELFYGNPTSHKCWVYECGIRLESTLDCRYCCRAYQNPEKIQGHELKALYQDVIEVIEQNRNNFAALEESYKDSNLILNINNEFKQ